MENPVTVASGTFGSGEEFADFVDLNKLGAVTTKRCQRAVDRKSHAKGGGSIRRHVKCHWSAESGD